MKEEALSTWDYAWIQGREESQEKEREKKNREFVIKTIVKFPNMKDADIASFVDVPIKFVRQIRKELQG